MATYTLISSNVLSSSAASVTFSSIPATYTDLVLRVSARNTDTGTINGSLKFTLNNLGTTIYSYTQLRGTGSAASSTRSSSDVIISALYISGGLATANTFGSTEIYIPNYTGTLQKPISAISMAESNDAAVSMGAQAELVNLTSAVTSIEITTVSPNNLLTGSSFYLYGISNA
jgi:hypothetical protein